MVPAAIRANLGSVFGFGLAGLLPLVVVVLLLLHVGARRGPLRTAFVRDTASFACHSSGKLLVAAILVIPPALKVLASASRGRYADDSWVALLMVVFTTACYATSRRLVLTVLIAGLVVSVGSWGCRNNNPGNPRGISGNKRRLRLLIPGCGRCRCRPGDEPAEMNYAELMHTRLFALLGMTHTGIENDHPPFTRRHGTGDDRLDPRNPDRAVQYSHRGFSGTLPLGKRSNHHLAQRPDRRLRLLLRT